MKHPRAVAGLFVFVCAFAYVWWMAGSVFNLGADEGIYLEGGSRVARFEWPYRDFFTVTGPLTFWIEGALAHWSGGNIVWMRVPMVLDVAFLAWAVFRMASHFASVAFSGGLAAVFLVYISRLNRLVVNHRWDSAALATAAIMVALAAYRRRCVWLWFAAGLLAAAAACATPSLALVALPLAVWSLRSGRKDAAAFAAGCAAVGTVLIGVLAAGGALPGFLETLRWVPENYFPANRVRYGVLMAAIPVRSLMGIPAALAQFGYLMLPALLPPLVLAGWMLYWWRRPNARAQSGDLMFLMAAACALVFATWPRWTVEQLHFALAPVFVLAGLLLHRTLPETFRRNFYILILCLTAWAAVNRSLSGLNYGTLTTRAGAMRGDRGDDEYMQGFERHIARGESLFVYPYAPSLYFLLDGRNPTRYSFLQPGMMTRADEQHALAELKARPPQWVVLSEIPAEAVMRVWPGSDPERIPMQALRQYLKDKYLAMDIVQGKWGSAILMKREQ